MSPRWQVISALLATLSKQRLQHELNDACRRLMRAASPSPTLHADNPLENQGSLRDVSGDVPPSVSEMEVRRVGVLRRRPRWDFWRHVVRCREDV